MKKLLLFACVLGGFSAMAQKDIAVAMVTPVEEQQIMPGEILEIEFTVTNSGTVALISTDSVYFALTIDGQNVYGNNVYWASTANTALAVGTSYNYAFEFPVNTTISQALAGDHDLCVVLFLYEGTNAEPTTEVTNTNNEDCSTVNFIAGTAAVNQIDAAKAITMYPNPVSDKLTFKTEGAVLSAINVHNLAGQLVDVIEVSATGTTTYDAATLEAGIYVVSFIGQNGASVRTEKLSVK